MNAKAWIDKKLILMILSPLARALLSLLTGYLTAKGVPAETVGQFGEALGVVAVLGFNVLWSLIDKRRAEVRGGLAVLRDLGTVPR